VPWMKNGSGVPPIITANGSMYASMNQIITGRLSG
jgi:hypothetical protein